MNSGSRQVGSSGSTSSRRESTSRMVLRSGGTSSMHTDRPAGPVPRRLPHPPRAGNDPPPDPRGGDRDQVRAIMQAGDFIEVFVDCPVETCEQRDVKGLYKKARAGEIPEFTGISAPYEAPLQPELTIRTGDQAVEASVAQILGLLEERGIVPRG